MFSHSPSLWLTTKSLIKNVFFHRVWQELTSQNSVHVLVRSCKMKNKSSSSVSKTWQSWGTNLNFAKQFWVRSNFGVFLQFRKRLEFLDQSILDSQISWKENKCQYLHEHETNKQSNNTAQNLGCDRPRYLYEITEIIDRVKSYVMSITRHWALITKCKLRKIQLVYKSLTFICTSRK